MACERGTRNAVTPKANGEDGVLRLAGTGRKAGAAAPTAGSVGRASPGAQGGREGRVARTGSQDKEAPRQVTRLSSDAP